MTVKTSLIAALLGAVLIAPAAAQVTVKDAWVRATVPQQKATGAFLQLTAATDSRLVGVSSSVVPVVELHEMAMDNNVMKMRQIAALELPAGKSVELKPGGYHLMLMDLKQQVKEGDTVPLTLVIEGPDGHESTGDGFNLSLGILVAHGWFYVVYLFSCFRVWSLMRWGFGRFMTLALGGIVPLLSFFMEAIVASEVKTYLATRESAETSAPAPEGVR